MSRSGQLVTPCHAIGKGHSRDVHVQFLCLEEEIEASRQHCFLHLRCQCKKRPGWRPDQRAKELTAQACGPHLEGSLPQVRRRGKSGRLLLTAWPQGPQGLTLALEPPLPRASMPHSARTGLPSSSGPWQPPPLSGTQPGPPLDNPPSVLQHTCKFPLPENVPCCPNLASVSLFPSFIPSSMLFPPGTIIGHYQLISHPPNPVPSTRM